MSKIADEVAGIAGPITEVQGLKLIDVEYIKEGSDWKLRVFVENPDGKLEIEDCEKVSKILSKELDRQDPIDKSYILEVSSPGLERPLKNVKDYRDNIGKFITITTYAPINNSKEFTGQLIKFKNNEANLKIDGKNKGVIKIPFSKIAHAHLAVDF